jgi:peptidyl-prolyl cis-trans isomerase B (cyclophilin B)
VISEAIDGLSAAGGHRFDDLYVGALASNASQVLQSAAKALAKSDRPGVADALLAAFDRVTALQRETMRDARVALADALKTIRDTTLSTQLRVPTQPLPTVSDLAALEKARAIIEMDDGSRVVLRLFSFDAPTNVSRFVRLARSGYFDGLTFHRVVPYFVVQGGSPAANEYMGDGPYTRDELALENARGTVGLSTRGRDSGDGQLYFNLIDNVQLDHDYTVWASVASGMDAVDRMQEGARIRRVTIR